ncbi:MAG: BrnT family toxin [Spirochaetaceae bacterium]|jgi:uncharacterized DUF497 family protein/uncharacterized protein (DUF4415 family)|nr:BrnT family toxin [Spirochaetaceae bacterium]
MFENIFYRYEWDEDKRRSNIEKHGIDFRVAIPLFSDRKRIQRVDKRKNYNEIRYQLIGAVDGVVLFAVYTKRGSKRRIISVRFATAQGEFTMSKINEAYTKIAFGITPEMLSALHKAEGRPVVYDEDAPELSAVELSEFKRVRGRPKKAVKKERIDLLLEPESARHLREGGRGWQTRLREYVEQGITAGVL